MRPSLFAACVLGAALGQQPIVPLSSTFCGPSGVSQSLKIGDQTYVCVIINGVVQAVFTPKVDQLAALSLVGSKLLSNKETDHGIRRKHLHNLTAFPLCSRQSVPSFWERTSSGGRWLGSQLFQSCRAELELHHVGEYILCLRRCHFWEVSCVRSTLRMCSQRLPRPFIALLQALLSCKDL
jgi:hypothetical protein